MRDVEGVCNWDIKCKLLETGYIRFRFLSETASVEIRFVGYILQLGRQPGKNIRLKLRPLKVGVEEVFPAVIHDNPVGV